MESPSVVVHLHLHQPPREDPWLGDVPRDLGATPDHDFTARVERECYRSLPAARVNDSDGRVRRLVDTLARSSFDVAPSLLAWLARERPSTYAAVVGAARAAVRRTGHGAALAHPYHHTILPLLSRRDKVTEVRWGLAEFRRRFGRDAEGLWLPETAADDETLDVLAEAGVRFTVLAPRQLQGVDGGALPPGGRPGLVRTLSGRELAVFAYDDAIANEVAFGGLLRDGRGWAARMRDAAAAAEAAEELVAEAGERRDELRERADQLERELRRVERQATEAAAAVQEAEHRRDAAVRRAQTAAAISERSTARVEQLESAAGRRVSSRSGWRRGRWPGAGA